MARSKIETLVGLIVLITALIFGWMLLFRDGSNLSSNGDYLVSASFFNASGTSTGTDVRVSGIKVGRVVEQPART